MSCSEELIAFMPALGCRAISDVRVSQEILGLKPAACPKRMTDGQNRDELIAKERHHHRPAGSDLTCRDRNIHAAFPQRLKRTG